MNVSEKLYTFEEFEEFLRQPENRDRFFELIDGEIVEKVPTLEHGVIALRIGSRLLIFVEAHGLGWVAVEVRYRVPDDNSNSRQPDVSFSSNARVPKLVKQGAVLQMPDLVVEVKSPDDTFIGQRRRAEYYIANGTRLVWLVYPEKQLVEVYQPNADIQILNIDDVLDGGDVLPGFTLSVRDIFPA